MHCLPSVAVDGEKGEEKEGEGVLCRVQASLLCLVAGFLPLLRPRGQPLYALHVAKLHLQATFYLAIAFAFAVVVVVVVLLVLHALLLYFIFLFLHFRFLAIRRKAVKVAQVAGWRHFFGDRRQDGERREAWQAGGEWEMGRRFLRWQTS